MKKKLMEEYSGLLSIRKRQKKCFIQILCQVEQDVEIVYGNDGFFLILNSLFSVLK